MPPLPQRFHGPGKRLLASYDSRCIRKHERGCWHVSRATLEGLLVAVDRLPGVANGALWPVLQPLQKHPPGASDADIVLLMQLAAPLFCWPMLCACCNRHRS